MIGTASPGSLAVPLSQGSLHGGQQPIQGAHVYLYAANPSGGYGSASTSLLTVGGPGATTDGNGNAYVTSAADGSFYYGGTSTCTSGTYVYLLAVGGNPTGTAGPDNSAIGLSAALGDCAGLNASTLTNMNEVSTVAMAYALNAFMADPTHVGSPASNSAGLRNAFATVKNLMNSSTGNALATTPGGNGVAPQQYVNTLANIIASCVNSAAATDPACVQLFTYATATSSPAPQDTLSALINIAAFPGASTANLYSLSGAVAPFQPSLSAQPNDFALGITFSAGVNVSQPGPVVIDSNGNIWMGNCQSCIVPSAADSIVEYDPTGAFLHSYSAASIHNPKGLAIDAGGTYLYSLNQAVGTHTQDQLTKILLSNGVVQGGFPVTFDAGTYGTNTFNGIAIDNSGEIWATATNSGAIVQVTPGGNLINGSPFFIGGTYGVAVDNIGNIWFAGIGGNNIIQFDTNGDFLNNFTPSGLNQPVNMAINGSNELITINQASRSLSKVEFFNGSNAGGSPYSNIGIFGGTVTAIDGTSQIIVPNCRVSCGGSGSNAPDNLLRLTQGGVPNTGGSGANYGAQISTFSGASGAAIDSSGNVWVSNSVSGKLTEVVGFASPTIQPLAAAAANGRIGQMP